MITVDLCEMVRRVLDAYRADLCPTGWNLLPFDFRREGPDIILTVKDETFAPRTVRGRLSGFMLLCGRYFGATTDDRAYAHEPVFLRRIESAEAVERNARESLMEAAVLLNGAGETEEAVLLLRRAALGSSFDGFSGFRGSAALPKDASRALRDAALRPTTIGAELNAVRGHDRRKVLMLAAGSFSHADPLERATAICAAADIIQTAERETCPELADIALPGLAELTRDPNAFIQEKALTALESLAKRLFVAQDFQHLAPAVEPLLAFGVYPAWQLERRYLCRLSSGDKKGAREDLQARLDMEPGRPREEVLPLSLENAARTRTQKAPARAPSPGVARKRRPIPELIRPEDFLDVVLESVGEDFVVPVRNSPGALEECLALSIALIGHPETSTYGFHGPTYVLRGADDARRAVEIYERLRKEYVPKGQPKGLRAVVEDIARLGAFKDDMRLVWSLVRDVFRDDAEGKAERARFEKAKERLATGEPYEDSRLMFGERRFNAAGDRATRAAELYRRAFAAGQGPALAEAVFGELPGRIISSRVLEPLTRRNGFRVTISFGPLSSIRRESFTL